MGQLHLHRQLFKSHGAYLCTAILAVLKQIRYDRLMLGKGLPFQRGQTISRYHRQEHLDSSPLQ